MDLLCVLLSNRTLLRIMFEKWVLKEKSKPLTPISMLELLFAQIIYVKVK
ncbi:MAG TPA: hypothetical protein VE307_06495 [Nitrososphaeraceae archaeon]|nr:hypothetical protein [Nitrososphaeraceae archaeon]